MPADGEVDRHDRMRRSESRVDCAVFGVQHQRLGRQVGPEAAGRRLGVEQRRQFVGIDGHEIGGVLGEVRVGREHDRDRFADVAQPVPSKQRLAIRAQRLAGRVAEIDRRQVEVVAGPHRGDAGCGERCRNVNGAQHRMGIGRGHDPHVQLMRETEIADKLAAPENERRVLEPQHRSAEDPIQAAASPRWSFASLAPFGKRRPHRGDDAPVAGAAAKI